MERTSVLNAKNPNVLNKVLREKYLEGSVEGDMRSECDDQLLISVMFAGTVKVKGIEIFGSRKDSGKWPTKLKVFVNAPNVDFTNVDTLPIAQEFNLSTATTDSNSLPLRYSTRAAKFFNVNSLTLLIEGAADGNGFEGEFSQSRVGAVKADYEVKPMLSDHKILEQVHSSIN